MQNYKLAPLHVIILVSEKKGAKKFAQFYIKPHKLRYLGHWSILDKNYFEE